MERAEQEARKKQWEEDKRKQKSYIIMWKNIAGKCRKVLYCKSPHLSGNLPTKETTLHREHRRTTRSKSVSSLKQEISDIYLSTEDLISKTKSKPMKGN